MSYRTVGLVRVVLAALLATVSSQAAETPASRCADCHFAQADALGRSHLSEWDHSAHGRANVGCERCHGGDPTTFEPFLAHQGMLSGQNPSSPIHRTNLPKTCGSCHPEAFAAFQKSRHYELLREGNRDAPNCVTCHGEVGAYLLSPKALFATCNRCHGPGRVAARSDLPYEGRIRLDQVREVRQTLDQAKKLIRQVKDKTRRAALEAHLSDARAPLYEAVQQAHMFVFDRMNERLDTARTRADLLMELLANPKSGTEGW